MTRNSQVGGGIASTRSGVLRSAAAKDVGPVIGTVRDTIEVVLGIEHRPRGKVCREVLDVLRLLRPHGRAAAGLHESARCQCGHDEALKEEVLDCRH